MKEIFSCFLKIGLLGFGGPMAHIAMMDSDLMDKKKWSTKDEFLDGLAVCNILPGPASTQLGIYMGFLRGGILGGTLAGIAFILPAFIIISILSFVYFKFGEIPSITGILYGINAVVIALISSSLLKMYKKTVINKPHAIFLPSFVFILVAAPYLKNIKNVLWAKAALKGVNAQL